MSQLTDPRYHSLRDWADFTVFDLERYAAIGRLDKEEDWQRWAAAIVGINGISQKNPPSPYDFSDWRDWAARFYQILD